MAQINVPKSDDKSIKYFVVVSTYAILTKWHATENTMFNPVYTLTDDSELPNADTRFTKEQIQALQINHTIPWLNWDVVTFRQAY